MTKSTYYLLVDDGGQMRSPIKYHTAGEANEHRQELDPGLTIVLVTEIVMRKVETVGEPYCRPKRQITALKKEPEACNRVYIRAARGREELRRRLAEVGAQ